MRKPKARLSEGTLQRYRTPSGAAQNTRVLVRVLREDIMMRWGAARD